MNLRNYEAVKKWKTQLVLASRIRYKKPLSKSNWNTRLSILNELADFANKSPTELVTSAQRDLDNTQLMLLDFFDWLQGKEFARIKKRSKGAITHNSARSKLGVARGFFTHNGITFPKAFAMPRTIASKVSVRDDRDPVWTELIEGEKRELNDQISTFMNNLGLRDRALAMCMLSTGVDTKDLLSLNMDFVLDSRGKTTTIERLFWEGRRLKNGFPFKTFIGKEATIILKQYVEQERKKAGIDSPLFTQLTRDQDIGQRGKLKGGTYQKRATTQAIQEAFKFAANKMGIVNGSGAHAFRPKRFRHVFSTACDIAGVPEIYKKLMMGHVISDAEYTSKKTDLVFEQFLKVENVLGLGSKSAGMQEIGQRIDVLSEYMTDELAKSNKHVQRLEQKLEKLGIGKPELREIAARARYESGEGASGGKSLKSDYNTDPNKDPLEDLDDNELDGLFVRALRLKLMGDK